MKGRIFLCISVLLVLCVPFLMGSGGGAEKEEEFPTIRVLAFAQGFAWPELFGGNGTERTPLLEQLEQDVGARIEIEWGDETAVRQKVLTDLIAHTGRYDILLAGSAAGIQSYGHGGFLEPLDDYFDEHPTEYFDPEDVYEKYLDANRMPPGGKLYALPYYSFGAGIMYRKDLFDRYGLKPPKTTDELMSVLEALKQGFARDGITDVYPVTMRGAPGEEPTLDLTGFVYAYSGYASWFEDGLVKADQIKDKNAKPIFTSPDFKDGFKAFVDISREYGPPGISTHTWVDMMNIYAAGKAAILMPSAINAYAALQITENPDVKNNTRFAKIPVGPSGKQIQSFWTFSMGINRDSKNKVKAWKVLTYLTGESAMQAFADRTQWPNVTMKSVMWSDTLVNRYGEDEIRLNEESIMEAEPYYFPYIPELTEFADKIGTAASRAIAGEDIDAVLNELQTWALGRMFKGGYYQ
jgi:ABC-type glycerol-3-phosphate transport system substrate-binding protein